MKTKQALSTFTSLAMGLSVLSSCGGSKGGVATNTIPQANIRCTADSQIAAALASLQAVEITPTLAVNTLLRTPGTNWKEAVVIQATNSLYSSEIPNKETGKTAKYGGETDSTIVASMDPVTGATDASIDCAYATTNSDGEDYHGATQFSADIGDVTNFSAETYTAGKTIQFSGMSPLVLGNEASLTQTVTDRTASAEEMKSQIDSIKKLKANPGDAIREMNSGAPAGTTVSIKFYRGTKQGKEIVIVVGNVSGYQKGATQGMSSTGTTTASDGTYTTAFSDQYLSAVIAN